LHAKLRRDTGAAAVAPARFHAFSDLEADVRDQIAKIRSHPWVPKSIVVRGFVFDVKTGRLKEVFATKAEAVSA
jgi:carbonic anhydrase